MYKIKITLRKEIDKVVHNFEITVSSHCYMNYSQNLENQKQCPP